MLHFSEGMPVTAGSRLDHVFPGIHSGVRYIEPCCALCVERPPFERFLVCGRVIFVLQLWLCSCILSVKRSTCSIWYTGTNTNTNESDASKALTIEATIPFPSSSHSS